jgi:hypothetical protein
MKFTVTSRVGVTEVVDRPESAWAALEHVLVLLGRKRTNVTSLMRRAGVERPLSYAGWQLEKLLCCPMMRLSIQACLKGIHHSKRPVGRLGGLDEARIRLSGHSSPPPSSLG